MPVIQLDIDATGAVRGIGQYAQATNQGATSTDRLQGSNRKAEAGLGSLAKKALAVGAAYVSIAKGIEQASKAAGLFAGFDDALRVSASYAGILDGAAQGYIQMAEAAKQAGATTSVTATTAAQALGELTSRGFTAQAAIAALLPTIRLAEAAQADLGKSAAVSSGIMAGLGKDVTYLARINDLIVGISGISSLNLNALGDAAKYAIPAARAVGEELESTMAVMGVLVDQQFEAAQSGNAYKNMLISLVSPSRRGARELQRMGVATKDSTGDFLGLIPVLEQFRQKTLTLSQAREIFGREWATAALAATNSIDEIVKDTNHLKTSVDGLSLTAAEFQQAGLGGEFRKLGSAVEAVYIAVGEQLAPMLQEVSKEIAIYAGQAKAAAEGTYLLLDGAQALSTGFIGLQISGQVVTQVVALIYEGYLKIARIKTLLGADKMTDDLRRELKALDDEIAINRIARQEIDKSIQGSFASYDKINAKIDEWRAKVALATADKERLVQADKDMQTAAEAAGIAAGKAAALQGKSFTEAASAAEAGKKSYLEQAKAAEQKQAADAKSTASATTAKAALEEQAKAIKEQALSYGFTAEQAEEAASKVLETAKAADGVSSAGIDALNKSLDNTVAKAQAADAALRGIGSEGLQTDPAAGGAITYTADIDLSLYKEKAAELKQDIDDFKANYDTYQLRLDGPPEFDAARSQLSDLEAAHSSAQKELEKQQGLDSLNQKLKETRSELAQTRQVLADGNLVIDYDPAATQALQGQIRVLNDAKLAAGSMGEGFELINGVLTNISPAAAAVRAAYEELAGSSGKIEAEWRQIDGVWTQVLPNGEKLIDRINERMMEGVAAAGEFGGAVSTAVEQIESGSAGADKIINDLVKSVESAAAKAGDLKFDVLVDSTLALETVRAQIKSLEKDIVTFGLASERGQEALAQILKLEQVENKAQTQLKALREEVFTTGEESKKTATAIEKIPVAAETAAAAVSNLSEANESLAGSVEGIDAATAALQEFGKTQAGEFTFSVGKSLEELTDKELDAVIKARRAIGAALTAQANKSPGMLHSVDSRTLSERDRIKSDYQQGYFDAQMEKLKRATDTIVEGVEESSRGLRRGFLPIVSAVETGIGRAETLAQTAATAVSDLAAASRIFPERDRIKSDYYQEYIDAQMDKLKRAASSLVEGVEESSRSLRRGILPTVSPAGIGTGRAETVAQGATYNFHGYSRSDIEDVISRSGRMAARA